MYKEGFYAIYYPANFFMVLSISYFQVLCKYY